MQSIELKQTKIGLRTMKLIISLVLIFLLNVLNAQEKPFSLNGSFYRLENLDSLNKYSLDSLRGELLLLWD